MLDIQNLRISFCDRVAVDCMNLTIEHGQSLAIVGESGSGKSITALAAMGLLPNTATVQGKILYDGEDVIGMSPRRLQTFRGTHIAMIFQEPMTSLNPVFTIGEQVMETILTHEPTTRRDARMKAICALEEVGIEATRFGSYPHEFSGGMRQRVLIAIALTCKPNLLIADEPTTALDTATSMQVVDLLRDLQQDRGMAIMFITHDLCIVPSIAQTICVMQSGKIVEKGETRSVLQTPKHHYTRALASCTPSFTTKLRRLPTIEDFC